MHWKLGGGSRTILTEVRQCEVVDTVGASKLTLAGQGGVFGKGGDSCSCM